MDLSQDQPLLQSKGNVRQLKIFYDNPSVQSEINTNQKAHQKPQTLLSTHMNVIDKIADYEQMVSCQDKVSTARCLASKNAQNNFK